ncbi:7-methyl-GTP pyrophosphatase-like [Triticum dicoccoides]|uniref:7-methyl-GTP pyrophosphatase-like n=1 Tax=Triticum dicoccoides TaxID=85692 RepID=UPI000E78FAF7|nr:7-methyl-GTP pyrophosphatase-like [Triticum dicoccoides]
MASTCNSSSSFKIILGSSSPARRAILSDMGYEFTVMSADIDERAIRREKPEELVKALAEAKADTIQLNLRNRDSRDLPTLLITSDQVKVSKGVIRERPTSTEEAREFIKGYSGDVAFAVNYVLVTNLSTGGRKGGWDIPEIYFHHIPDEFIEKVVKEGGMTCVAGGLRLMHPSALPFIKELVGTMDSVRGLPRNLTEKLIRESLQETVEM